MTRSILIAALALWPALAGAQTPSGLPEGYTGRQFTDAAGCQFQRGDDGSWTPRLGRDGQPICGYPDTQAQAESAGPRQVLTAAEDPYAALAQDESLHAPGGGAPHLQFPDPDAPAPVQAASAPPAEDPAAALAQDDSIRAPAPTMTLPRAVVPTAQASAAPAQTKAARQTPRRSATRKASPRRTSRKGASASTAGHRYVQVGAFALPANARRAEQRMLAMGLPVSRGKSKIGGEWLEVIMAGPFEDRSALRAARSQLRQNGYPRAFTR